MRRTLAALCFQIVLLDAAFGANEADSARIEASLRANKEAIRNGIQNVHVVEFVLRLFLLYIRSGVRHAFRRRLCRQPAKHQL